MGVRYEDMLSHQFYKLVKDSKLLNGRTLTKASVDIVYWAARAQDEALETYTHKAGVAATARMYYPQFIVGEARGVLLSGYTWPCGLCLRNG